jgi:hypothetical protein
LKIFKKYEPIGCRDEKTVVKLKALGVKAYFSGCLTTTISFYKVPKVFSLGTPINGSTLNSTTLG